jgi:hypothetical protein
VVVKSAGLQLTNRSNASVAPMDLRGDIEDYMIGTGALQKERPELGRIRRARMWFGGTDHVVISAELV